MDPTQRNNMANAEPSTTGGVSKIIIPFFDPESKAPTETLDEVLAVAQQVEASRKEVKREVAVIEAGFSDDEEVEVGAVNARKGQAAAGQSRFPPSQAGSSKNGGATSRRPGGTMGDC